MKIVSTPNGTKIKYYSTAKEGSMSRYNEFTKYQLLDSGVGSDMDAVTTRFSKIFAFFGANKPAEAQKEAENLYFTHYTILEKINFNSYAFACLVHSINDVVYNDLSEDGLKLVIKELEKSELSQADLESAVDDAKKKSLTS